MFVFAHISDPHLPPLPAVGLGAVANKRILGYLSWHRKRKLQHRDEILKILQGDLRHQSPDHICVTGDLTNLGLPEEFAATVRWLAEIGPPSNVSVIPGNHDAYLDRAANGAFERWRPWMCGDDGLAAFPYLRRRGPVDFFGVSSAVPTAPLLATGRVGPAQRARLADGLAGSGRQARFRVVMIHHPPQEGAVSRRRRLSDGGALRRLLGAAGAELVLHGHVHRPVETAIPGPGRPIPVLGAASASASGAHGAAVAHYHLLRLERSCGGWRLAVEHRSFDSSAGRFVASGERELRIADAVTT